VTHENAITVSDLSVEYPAHGASASCVALRGVSLRVEPGEVLGLLGETGSGKSTLARILAGREVAVRSGEVAPRITGGDATVRGYSLRRLRKRQRASLTFHVGFLEQDAGARLPSTFTVSEIIAAPIFVRDRHYSQRAAGERVATILDAVHLPLGLLSKYPYELSSGQRQRVAIAQALVLGPSILIADEPTATIDATVRDSVVDLILQLQASREFAAIVISHDLAVLRKVTTSVAVLQHGRLVGFGPIDELLRSPEHPYVVGLAAALNPRQASLNPRRAEAGAGA
jgi:ABC-type glutathione transport system ATPase component